MPFGYNLQFTVPFAAIPIAGVASLWRIQFYRKGYSGAVTELTAGGSPWKEEVQEGLTGVKAKKIQIEVIGISGVDLLSFYTDSDRAVLVELQQKTGTSTYITRTTGWLNPYDASEPYQVAPYKISLTATCGLGSLQDFPLYRYPNNIAYADRVTIHDLLYNCLNWVGYEIPLRTWTGRYESSMLVSGAQPADSYDPLSNVRVNPRRWLKTDGTYESCKKVLDDLCTMYGAMLSQKNGVWAFLSIDTTTRPQKWHHYDTAITSSPTLVTENLSYYAGTGQDVRWERGSSVGIVAPKKTIKLSYDYGEPINLLLNGDFTSGFSSWTVTQNAGQLVEMNGDGSDDNPFRAKINGQTAILGGYIAVQPSLKQTVSIARGSFVVGSVNREGQARLQTEVHILNLSGTFVNLVTTGAIVYVYVTVGAKTYFLHKENGWINGDKGAYLAYDNYWSVNGAIEAKPTKGERFEITSPPVPGSGNYTVTVMLYAGGRIQPAPATGLRSITYRDVRLSLTNGNDIPIKGEQWTVAVGQDDPLERKRTTELQLVLGDQLSVSTGTYQSARYGAMTRNNGNPTTSWLMNSRGDRFQKLTAWSLLRWISPKLRTMEGKAYLIDPTKAEPNQFTEIAVADMTPPYLGVVTGWSWDVRSRSVDVKLHEYPVSLITETYKGSYETTDGVLVPITEPVDLSAPVPVPTNPAPRQNTTGTTAPAGAFTLDMLVYLLRLQLGLTATPKPPGP